MNQHWCKIYLKLEVVPYSFSMKKGEKYKINTMVFKQLNAISVIGLRVEGPLSSLISARIDSWL